MGRGLSGKLDLPGPGVGTTAEVTVCVLAWSHSWLLSHPGPTLPSENRLLLLLHPVPAETKNTQVEGKKKNTVGVGEGEGQVSPL